MPAQPAHEGFHWRIWGAEFVGTALLVFGGLSVVCFLFGRDSPGLALLPSHSLRLLLTGIFFSGLNSLLAISPPGRLSGAHLNPVVTLSFRVLGRVGDHDLVGYLTAQVLGALVGAAVLRFAWRGIADSVDGGITVPTVSAPTAFVVEAGMTAFLIAVILFFVSRAELARWTPLAIWPLIALLVWLGAPFTGTSLNPARSVGPALVFNQRLDVLWLYALAPTTGALLVALAWRRRHPAAQPKTAKLFHDARYPCSLATDLPAERPASRVTPVPAPRL
jgi:aquaporin Z